MAKVENFGPNTTERGGISNAFSGWMNYNDNGGLYAYPTTKIDTKVAL